MTNEERIDRLEQNLVELIKFLHAINEEKEKGSGQAS
jgi:hypothetical protein